MKRFFTLMLCLILTSTLCCGVASANTSASDYLSTYSATLFTGKSSGQLRLDFDVTGKPNATTIGVSQIDLYKENGTFVKTIVGSERNGLVVSGHVHVYSYYFSATAGQKYYAEVWFSAQDDDGGGDGRIVTTNVATAKS